MLSRPCRKRRPSAGEDGGADDTTLMAESKEELKSLLMKVNGESEKAGLMQSGRLGFNPRVGKIPWRRERLLTSVFWPEEFHGLYSPWGHKE